MSFKIPFKDRYKWSRFQMEKKILVAERIVAIQKQEIKLLKERIKLEKELRRK